jgi:hypothetical protein
MTQFPLVLAAIGAALPTLALPSAASAQDPVKTELQALRQRIDELEDQQATLSEKVGSRAIATSYSAQSFDFGGHVTSLFTHIEGESDDETGHMVSLIELFVRATIDDEWSLFASPGFYTFNGALLDNPATPAVAGDPLFTPDNATTENLFLSRAYAQWKHSDHLVVQGGVVGSPHGPTNREYFIPARTIAQANLHTRIFLTNQLYPQYLNGVKASGSFPADGGDMVTYDAYFGSQPNSPADGLGGARLAYTVSQLGLTLAANYGRGTRQGTTSPTTNFGILQSPFAPSPNQTRDYEFVGVDVDWRSGAWIAKTEAYYSAEQNVADKRAFSTEWTYFVTPMWGLSYRFDYFDGGGDDINPGVPVVIASLGHSTEHVVGVCYNPNASVRLRLDFHHNNLPNTSDTVDYVNVSWSVSF